jgi:hypothetical protein
MSIDYSAIVKDLLTWASAAKVVAGAALHKAWTWLKAKLAQAEADAKAIEAKAAADIKKL